MRSNEKEISHGRAPLQARRSCFVEGPFGFIAWLDG
jgi:hypothetical protein